MSYHDQGPRLVGSVVRGEPFQKSPTPLSEMPDAYSLLEKLYEAGIYEPDSELAGFYDRFIQKCEEGTKKSGIGLWGAWSRASDEFGTAYEERHQDLYLN